MGFGMGLEFQESANMLNAKNDRKVQAGMVFNVVVGEWPTQMKPVCALWGLAWQASEGLDSGTLLLSGKHVYAL